MQDIYLISGLGADERAFNNLDLSGFNITFLDWIQPYPNELIEKYAERFRERILSIKPILIGLSLGGILAIEIAKQIDTQAVVIISSIKSRDEIPFYLRLIGKLKIHKMMPLRLLKRPNYFTYWIFGVKSSVEKNLLKNILKDTNIIFLKWAIDTILKWKNVSRIQNLLHIHGTSDRIIPIRYVNPDIVIPKGGHFMILNRAKEINEIIRRRINS